MSDLFGLAALVAAGLIAGWIAGVAMNARGYGRAGDVAIGAVGAFAGAWLFVFLAPPDDPNLIIGTVIVSAVCAAAFVAIARLVTHRRVATTSP